MNFKIKTLSDLPEMLSEREAGAIQGKRMKRFKRKLHNVQGHTEEDKKLSQSQRKMKEIQVKHIAVLSDGRTFMKSVVTKQLLKKKTRVKYDALFHEMYCTSLSSKLWGFSYVCNQII